jgi:hypothetical protein
MFMKTFCCDYLAIQKSQLRLSSIAATNYVCRFKQEIHKFLSVRFKVSVFIYRLLHSRPQALYKVAGI